MILALYDENSKLREKKGKQKQEVWAIGLPYSEQLAVTLLTSGNLRVYIQDEYQID
jgi:hypothetical protein